MGIKYNKTMVNDYIMGNDILEYELEQLENDSLFMSDVMIQSKDKKMYDFASDEVKKDYTFVKKVIEVFKNEQDFIIDVANYYLENAIVNEDEDITKFELNIIMNSIIKEENKRIKFGLNAMIEYRMLMVEVAGYNNAASEDKSMVDIGLGFLYLKTRYSYCPIILDYVAEKIVGELFYDENDKLEEKLHSIAKTKENITVNGVNNFIVNHILAHDEYLANYVATKIAEDPKFLEELKKGINVVLNRWDYYEKNKFQRKIDIIWQEGSKEHKKYKTNYFFLQFFETAIVDLGLKEIYEKYSDGFIVGNYMIEEELTSLGDISFMKYLKNLVSKEFGNIKIDETPNDYEQKKAEVLSFSNKIKK